MSNMLTISGVTGEVVCKEWRKEAKENRKKIIKTYFPIWK